MATFRADVRLCPHVVECNETIDLAFVLHSAETVHPERWNYVTQFAVDIIQQMDVGLNRTRVAVITFSDIAHVRFTLDRFAARQDVIQVVMSRQIRRSLHYNFSFLIFTEIAAATRTNYT